MKQLDELIEFCESRISQEIEYSKWVKKKNDKVLCDGRVEVFTELLKKLKSMRGDK